MLSAVRQRPWNAPRTQAFVLVFARPAGSAEFRAAMNRLTEVDAVLALIDRFYDKLIACGATRTAPDRDETLGAEAA